MLKICFDVLCRIQYTKPPRKGVRYWMNIPTLYVCCVQACACNNPDLQGVLPVEVVSLLTTHVSLI